MTDAEALDTLRVFAEHHARCCEGPVTTALSEAQGSDGIRVVRRCQTCRAETTVTITRGAAVALLREGQ